MSDLLKKTRKTLGPRGTKIAAILAAIAVFDVFLLLGAAGFGGRTLIAAAKEPCLQAYRLYNAQGGLGCCLRPDGAACSALSFVYRKAGCGVLHCDPFSALLDCAPVMGVSLEGPDSCRKQLCLPDRLAGACSVEDCMRLCGAMLRADGKVPAAR